MKKIKSQIFFLASAMILLGSMLIPTNESYASSTVQDKKAIDCGAYFGTKCVPDGDGCDPKACDDDGGGLLG